MSSYITTYIGGFKLSASTIVNLFFGKKKKGIKIVILGGLGTTGSRSCIALFHPKTNELVIFDIGVDVANLFQNQEDVDRVVDARLLPNFEWFRIIEAESGRPIKVLAIFITHRHLDHIGGLTPYLQEFFFDRAIEPPFIFCDSSTGLFLKYFFLDKLYPRLYFTICENIMAIDQEISLGPFRVRPISMPHSTPGNLAYAVVCENQKIFLTSDFKTRLDSVADQEKCLAQFDSFKPDFLICDATGAKRPGYTALESDVKAGLHEVLSNAKGRIYITFFSTNLKRFMIIRELCQELGITLAVLGASFKPMLMSSQDPELEKIALDNPTPNAKVVCITGPMGNYEAVSARLSRGEEVNGYRVVDSDSVVISASQIQSCRHAQMQMIHNFAVRNAHIHLDCNYPAEPSLIVNSKVRYDGIYHVSGHGSRCDLRAILMRLMSKRLRLVLAYHADLESMMALKDIAVGLGIDESKVPLIVPSENEIISINV